MTLNLLVVEDSPKHLADARAYFSRPQIADKVAVTYATTFDPVFGMLCHGNADRPDDTNGAFHGVISDVFMPITNEHQSNDTHRGFIGDLAELLREYIGSANWEAEQRQRKAFAQWEKGDALPPAGVRVALLAKSLQKPVVLNTDGYHHSYALQPAYGWSQHAGVRMIDTGKGGWDEGGRIHVETPGTAKDWKKAYCAIIAQIESKQRGEEGWAEEYDEKGIQRAGEFDDRDVLKHIESLTTEIAERGASEPEYGAKLEQMRREAEEKLAQIQKNAERFGV